MRIAPLFLLSILWLSACSFKSIHRHYDLTYLEQDNAFELPEKQLDVYTPKRAENVPVLIFIHGGSWNSGNKDIYRFLGARMARRGVATVIINYPLSPEYDVQDMVKAAALASDWTKQHIAEYGGDPERIFISGHSAGGHLAAVLTVRDEPFKDLGLENPVQGAVLIDAAGLDMKWFLEQMDYAPGTAYRIPFTDDPRVWKDTSPIYYLDESTRPQLIFMGGKTLPGIALTTERYLEASAKAKNPVTYHLQKKKKHKGMIVQFANTLSPVYRKVRDFMEE
jgi:acetyl esterase/lipase